MLTIEKVDPKNRSQVKRFIDLPFRLYKGVKQWVPLFRADVALALNPEKHPFYEHAAAEFYIARREDRDVGRLGVIENTAFNEYHQAKEAQFYYFDCEEDPEVAAKLFERAYDWAHARGLNKVVGPKGFGPLDGYGLLYEGYEHRTMMTMMNYNYPYYVKLIEGLGFEKEVDFISCYLNADSFQIPEKVHLVAEKVVERGIFGVKRFSTKKELRAWAPKIGEAYNKTFVNNWEFYPFTQREIDLVVSNMILAADPALIKIITFKEDVVGFLFGFPDVSSAMQRAQGRITPWGIADLVLEMRKTDWVAINGAGVLPEYHGRGGNALLYSEMEKTVRENGRFKHADLTQVADTAVQMRKDLVNVGGKLYKTHRVFHKDI